MRKKCVSIFRYTIAGPPVRNFDWGGGGADIFLGAITCHKYSLFSYFLVKYVYCHCELNYNFSNSQEIAGFHFIIRPAA